MRIECPVCDGENVSSLVSVPGVPILCNQLCMSPSQARAVATAPIELVLCRTCGHVFNLRYEASFVHYDVNYENSLHHSEHFRSFSDQLAADLCGRHSLRGKTILEVGCGQGEFLRRLCAVAGADGYGFDPGYHESQPLDENVKFVRKAVLDVTDAPTPDLLCCRHVLEHVERPVPFFSWIVAKLLASGPFAVYLEVPNALYTLRDEGIWDLVYEHPSYFTPPSFTAFARRAGLRDVETLEAYRGQFLSLHARAGGSELALPVGRDAIEALADLGENFARTFAHKIAHWEQRLSALLGEGKAIAVWGAGSKGNTFLNLIAAGRRVPYVIDVNPAKQGHFVAGTGQPIVGPERLRGEPPDTVIVMNPVYFEEIRSRLGSLGIHPEFLLA